MILMERAYRSLKCIRCMFFLTFSYSIRISKFPLISVFFEIQTCFAIFDIYCADFFSHTVCTYIVQRKNNYFGKANYAQIHATSLLSRFTQPPEIPATSNVLHRILYK